MRCSKLYILLIVVFCVSQITAAELYSLNDHKTIHYLGASHLEVAIDKEYKITLETIAQQFPDIPFQPLVDYTEETKPHQYYWAKF